MTKQQKQIIQHTEKIVRNFFVGSKDWVHSFGHVDRVRKWAVKIAKAEKANVFIAEMAALLHDVGRMTEKNNEYKKTHHELSYELCRVWFKSDAILNAMPRQDKIKILYAVKYHWNDAADKYLEAIILRDADKLDGFGKLGVERSKLWKKSGGENGDLDLRLRYQFYYWVKTKSAKKFIEQYKLMKPVDAYYLSLLKSKIKPVKL